MVDADPVLASSARIASRPAGGSLARALIVLAALCLPLGLWLPVMETRQLWVFRDA